MGFFDLFKKKRKIETSVSSIDDLCSDNAYKKHVIMYLLMNPETCNYICKDIIVPGQVEFVFDKSGIYTDDEKSAPFYFFIFVWIIKKARREQSDFIRLFEILNRSHVELYSAALFMSANQLMEKIRYYFPEFKLSNNPEKVKTTLEWTYIDICAMHEFFIEATKFVRSHLNDDYRPANIAISECKTLNDIQDVILTDFKKGSFID